MSPTKKRPLFMSLALDVHCEICDRHRSHGNHKKCSEQRKRNRLKRLKREAENAKA